MVIAADSRPQAGIDVGRLTQLRKVSEPRPSCTATPVTTPWLRPDSLMASRTILTARSRSSGGYRRCDACLDEGCFDDIGSYPPKEWRSR